MENSDNRETEERNQIGRYVRDDINNYISGDYNYEIELSSCQKLIIVALNILTGGFGTILVHF